MNSAGSDGSQVLQGHGHRSEDWCALEVTGDDVSHPAYTRIRCLDELLSGVSPGQPAAPPGSQSKPLPPPAPPGVRATRHASSGTKARATSRRRAARRPRPHRSVTWLRIP